MFFLMLNAFFDFWHRHCTDNKISARETRMVNLLDRGNFSAAPFHALWGTSSNWGHPLAMNWGPDRHCDFEKHSTFCVFRSKWQIFWPQENQTHSELRIWLIGRHTSNKLRNGRHFIRTNDPRPEQFCLWCTSHSGVGRESQIPAMERSKGKIVKRKFLATRELRPSIYRVNSSWLCLSIDVGEVWGSVSDGLGRSHISPPTDICEL